MNVSVRISLLGAIAFAVLAAAASPALARDVPRGFFGTVYDGAIADAPASLQEQQFSAMSRAGVESVRAVFVWAAAQPQPGTAFDFTASDSLVRRADEHGMAVLPVVMGTPQWAALKPGDISSPPTSVSDYAAYIRALVLRYGNHGSFWSANPRLPYRPIAYWQIWNEPHLRLYWDAPGWERGYGALLRAASHAAKSADSGARIVLAGLTGAAWDALGSLYRNSRVRGTFDVAALQTYTGSASNLLKAVHLFRRVLRAHGAGRMPMWLTEMGWPAAQGKIRVPVYQRTIATTDRGMAQRLSAGYNLMARVRARNNARIARVFWYTWASPYRPSSDPGTGMFRYAGLVRYDGHAVRATPSLRAYARAAHAHESTHRRKARHA